MKTKLIATMTFGMLMTGSTLAWAGEASTSAIAASNGGRSGTAAATADYDGNGIGFTKTKAESGRVNFARGISLGFDEGGLSLSTSYAIAPQFGPAAAGTFNMNVGLDGSVSGSTGRTIADGSRTREVSAGGWTGNNRLNSSAGATVAGNTGPRGRVIAESRSFDRPSRIATSRIGIRR